MQITNIQLLKNIQQPLEIVFLTFEEDRNHSSIKRLTINRFINEVKEVPKDNTQNDSLHFEIIKKDREDIQKE